MALNQIELQKALRCGDSKRVAALFLKAKEDQRQSLAKPVMDWCALLELNWRAQFSTKAKKELAGLETIKNYDDLMPSAHAAALACASLTQIKTIGFVWGQAPIEETVAILKDRRPSWVDEYAEFLCGNEADRRTSLEWRRVRALVRAGLCRQPQSANYALGALEGIWPPFNLAETLRRKDRGKAPLPEPNLVELLLAERDWLEGAFWRLFEVEGNGEVSLANCEKYGKSRQTWTDAIVELSRRNVLSRERLLDASLAALSRDFIQFRASWFSRFHEALKPTPQERTARIEVYLNLLASNIPPTVALATGAVAVACEETPLPATKLLPALQPVLNARGKAVVKTALQLLDRVAAHEPAARNQVCLAAIAGLLNQAPDVQKQVFALLDKYGDKRDATLRAGLESVNDAVAASLRSRLQPWLHKKSVSTKATTPKSKRAEIPNSHRPVSRTDSSRAINAIDNLDDLLHLAGIVLEQPENPHDIERVLDGISRLCHQRPDDFAGRAGPLRKRALKKRDDKNGNWPRHPVLDQALAMTILSWIDSENAFTRKAEELAHGQNQFAFLFRRLHALAQQAAERRALPMLSAPTHIGGWIEPAALVERWLEWQRAGATPDPHEQVLSLLRLAPENRESALISAKAVKGESGQALRFALGEEIKTGRDAALWLAAWRSRQPFGDLPDFEKAHPRLGPDAGTIAQYKWHSQSERHKFESSQWSSLELEISCSPKCPNRIPDALLPVLFHGKWEANEESAGTLLRWATFLWPANYEAIFARAAKRLAISVNYADVLDREFSAYLEPLANPHTELRPMACLALALGLAVQDNALRGRAQDGLIAIIAEGRLNAEELGSTMSRLLDTGHNKLARWSKSLGEVARVSSAHANASADLLQRAFHGDPAKAPRDLGALLELLVELLSETGAKLEDAATRTYLSNAGDSLAISGVNVVFLSSVAATAF